MVTFALIPCAHDVTNINLVLRKKLCGGNVSSLFLSLLKVQCLAQTEASCRKTFEIPEHFPTPAQLAEESGWEECGGCD